MESIDELAKELFEAASKAQWCREHPKEPKEEAKVQGNYLTLHPCVKDNYRAMADYVFKNFQS